MFITYFVTDVSHVCFQLFNPCSHKTPSHQSKRFKCFTPNKAHTHKNNLHTELLLILHGKKSTLKLHHLNPLSLFLAMLPSGPNLVLFCVFILRFIASSLCKLCAKSFSFAEQYFRLWYLYEQDELCELASSSPFVSSASIISIIYILIRGKFNPEYFRENMDTLKQIMK
ncbi:hypothetical protein MIMGU_mgv1a015053mg [Erythranthe guttata]|uniref:Uncharacterized protein n=1 Tax=Erythranthe guttata TaxID=4155 RepID=A0A022RPN0_ERYGU|nr:hypothetical protein MIMGU_mgv1a015053mg [Erythranthe guttata]